jgi:benzil reductase ((S)-benzoin forming)
LSDPTTWSPTADWINGLIAGQAWNRIVMVHNAATLDPIGFAGEVDSAAYAQNVLLNSAAPQVLGDRFIASARSSNAESVLIQLSSGAGRVSYPGWSSYCAAKAAVDMWVRTAGAEQASRPACVTVLSVAPGSVDTAMQALIREQTGEAFPEVEAFQGLKSDGNLAAPSDVARGLLALMQSQAGDVVNGMTITNGDSLNAQDFV